MKLFTIILNASEVIMLLKYKLYKKVKIMVILQNQLI